MKTKSYIVVENPIIQGREVREDKCPYMLVTITCASYYILEIFELHFEGIIL